MSRSGVTSTSQQEPNSSPKVLVSERPSKTDAASNEGGPPKRRRHHGLLILGAITLGIALLLGGDYYWRSTFYESTDDAYIEGHPIVVSARISGDVTRVHATDNQRVEADALLVEIDPCDYQARLDRAQAAVDAAEAAERQVVADIDVAEARLAQEKQDLQRYEELAEENAVATQILDHSRASTHVAEANLRATRMHLASVKAQIAESKATADEARLELSYTRVYAPRAGYVTQKTAVPGGFVSVGQPLLSIVTEEMYVTANFKETQLARMRPGQPASISIDAYPGIALKGHVESIQAGTGAAFSLFPPENATGNFVKVVQRVPVKIVFERPDDPNHFLALGMSVEPKVKGK
jgi:membrane fusion protein, multidrug efflux system